MLISRILHKYENFRKFDKRVATYSVDMLEYNRILYNGWNFDRLFT